MEGLYFEVKPRKRNPTSTGNYEKPKPRSNRITHNYSCPSLSNLTSSSHSFQKHAQNMTVSQHVRDDEEEAEEELQYKLTMIGALPVHHLTTMAMLPWVVAEIYRCHPAKKDPRVQFGGRQCDPTSHHRSVLLCVSASWVRCVSALAEGVVWDPLTHTVLFECRPHFVTKLMLNSQEPSSFACLVKNTPNCACYVFRCQDSTKVGVQHFLTVGSCLIVEAASLFFFVKVVKHDLRCKQNM